jgi:hypothetical protein
MATRPVLIALALLALPGCYASHAQWEHAAPDGSAVWMRIESGALALDGFLEVREDGRYLASPWNEVAVCTGTLDDVQLGAWAALIERTGAFERSGHLGPDVDDGVGTSVQLRSEGGREARFSFNWVPELTEFRTRVEDFWQTLDPRGCGPATLDPEATSLRTFVMGFDPLNAFAEAEVEVDSSGDVRGHVAAGLLPLDIELHPCTPLASPGELWAAVLASRPFDRRSGDGWHEASVSVRTVVTSDDGSRNERSIHFRLAYERPEHRALWDALVTIVDEHCR